MTDIGSAYAAKENRDSAAALNRIACFTLVQSPEPNGISENFFITFKQDYVRVNPLPIEVIALGKIAGWFKDYTRTVLTQGSKCAPPREFIRAQTQ